MRKRAEKKVVAKAKSPRATPKAAPKKAARKKVASKKAALQLEKAELEILQFEDQAAWLHWLTQHHGSAKGVWIRLAKRAAGITSINVAQAVEAALCWGWIDGQGRSYDNHTWLVKFTPRRARSVWSKINRERATALIERGEMQAPGLLEVKNAQRDGRWERAYDSPRNAVAPDDLVAALAKNKKAKLAFEQLDGANRYAILWRLQTAKRAETRAQRIVTFVAMLARGETLHPPRKKKTPRA